VVELVATVVEIIATVVEIITTVVEPVETTDFGSYAVALNGRFDKLSDRGILKQPPQIKARRLSPTGF
jgi:hypothetical protein